MHGESAFGDADGWSLRPNAQNQAAKKFGPVDEFMLVGESVAKAEGFAYE